VNAAPSGADRPGLLACQTAVVRILPKLNGSLLVRTDFSSDDVWLRACAAVAQESEEGFRAYVELISDPAFDGASWQAVQHAVPKNNHGASVLFIADREALATPDYPLLAVGIGHNRREPPFRCIAAHLWSVDNNLNISNMDWRDFTGATDENDIYRGFTPLVRRPRPRST